MQPRPRLRFSLRLVTVVAILLCSLPVALAQDPNACDEDGESPDVIVGDLHQITRYGDIGGITAFAVGTYSCNIGSCWLEWFDDTNRHPVIGQNMYRYHDGRFEQIGMSWLKHGFLALNNTLCETGCIPTNGEHLGVNCADPYDASLNGFQGGLGPRSEVNPSTGNFPYPFTTIGQGGNTIYKRLQVHNEDLDPDLFPGAAYYVEGHYVTPDDAAADRADNNASFRPVDVTRQNGSYFVSLTGETNRGNPAIRAWRTQQPTVLESFVDVRDGRFILASLATDLGNGRYRYEYALFNLNSHNAAGSFVVPVPMGADIDAIGFHDVDYHSGEPYDGTDWPAVIETANGSRQVRWATDPFGVNPNANALRWSTLYNFRFESDAAPLQGNVRIGHFLPGSPPDPSALAYIPDPCDGDGTCELGEDCNNCPADCDAGVLPPPVCGDGNCDVDTGEDCVSCAADCAGVQGGNPGNRYCCGDGDGTNPIGCNDPRCTANGLTCGPQPAPSCCGDGECTGAEDSCACGLDCGFPPATEIACADGADDDCDGLADCVDLDCCTDGACLDGIDADGDAVAECDCDDSNSSVWATPTEVEGLVVDGGAGATVATLTWSPPLETGASTVDYETLRASSADDFGMASCMADPDPQDTTIDDADVPSLGAVFHYLVRAVNGCPAGIGPLGGGGAAATAETCP